MIKNTNKKIEYSIRMLKWHTKLAIRYSNYIKKWLARNSLNCEKEIQKNIKILDENRNQTTIYDFIKE